MLKGISEKNTLNILKNIMDSNKIVKYMIGFLSIMMYTLGTYQIKNKRENTLIIKSLVKTKEMNPLKLCTRDQLDIFSDGYNIAKDILLVKS